MGFLDRLRFACSFRFYSSLAILRQRLARKNDWLLLASFRSLFTFKALGGFWRALLRTLLLESATSTASSTASTPPARAALKLIRGLLLR